MADKSIPLIPHYDRLRVGSERLRQPHFESVLLDDGCSFYVGKGQGSHFAFYWHYHPELEIDLVLRGKGLRFVGDSIDNFEEGDLCLIGSNLPHTWSSIPRKGKKVSSIFVQFSPAYLDNAFFNAPEVRRIKSLFLAARRGLRFDNKTRDIVAKHLIALNGRPRGSWLRISDLLCILGALSDSPTPWPLSGVGPAPLRSRKGDARLRDVLEFMHGNPPDIPSQEMAATYLDLSPQAFSRFFRRSLGKTYVRYRNELRVNRACRFLADTDRSIIDVAMSAGFANLSNFNKQFLAIKGLHPRVFRQAALQATSSNRE